MPQENEMREGRITQTAWKRSVGRKLHTKRKETIWEPAPWEKYSGFEAEGSIGFVWADAQASGYTEQTGYYAVYHAAGELAARGVSAVGASVRVLFPKGSSENRLAGLASEVERACSELKVQVTGLDGEVTEGVSRIIVFVSAAGTIPERSLLQERYTGDKDVPGSIILCGYAGLEGMLRILGEAGEDLSERFVSSFLARAETLSKDMVKPGQLLETAGCDVKAVRQIGSGESSPLCGNSPSRNTSALR